MSSGDNLLRTWETQVWRKHPWEGDVPVQGRQGMVGEAVGRLALGCQIVGECRGHAWRFARYGASGSIRVLMFGIQDKMPKNAISKCWFRWRRTSQQAMVRSRRLTGPAHEPKTMAGGTRWHDRRVLQRHWR